MNIAFRTAGFGQWDLLDALRAIKAAGFDGVELCLEHQQMRPEALTPEAAAGWAARVAQEGLQIASVSYHGDRDEPQLRLQCQLRSITLTQAMGSDLLILNTPRANPEAEGQWGALVQWLDAELLPEAQRHGVRLAFEPEPGLLLHGTQEMLRLLSHLPHPLLGVNLDIGHAWLTDEDVTQSVRTLAPWLWHVHWEDFPAGEHRHLVPGEGDMPLAAIRAALDDIGYSGFYTVDLFNISDDPVRHAQASARAMRRGSGGH